ncbi:MULTISPECIES: DUF1365 domain-containing protein [unclassified Bradyrhizobium]|uniref:DUF1365 domain-containing protein n=1 Tax=unclassified Bradyrhizobium TaxID=2631580 RepID=UPI0024B10726|nr:DUF1365 domain-containing protein [Bradyrhizobium sp. CB2312]WFU74962.1 DUF1365 domain-containing protein [Bradyrhizobium sp. CB2312]
MFGSRPPRGNDQVAPVVLYRGKVMHARWQPVQHRFTYEVMSLLIDLDRLDDADRQSRLFGVNRAAIFSFHERDHGNRAGAKLSQYARKLAVERGIDLSGGRVLLLCYPRLLGYVFNPLSIYFCYRASGELALLIYEVRNTFGEMHSYVLPVLKAAGARAIRQTQAKEFYVSPFMEMRMQYRFSISPPARHVRVRILQTNEQGAIFAAAFIGRRRRLTGPRLVAAFFGLPLVTVKVMIAIHWEALWLWIKGVPYVTRMKQGGI